MADLSRIPIHYFQQTDAYGFVVDNRPLEDLANQIVAVNNDIISLRNSVSSASGTANSLADRLNVSLEQDGSIKENAVPEHSIENHTDEDDFVRMTSEERTKLSGVAVSATNFGVSLNSDTPMTSGVLNIEDSASVKIYEGTEGVKFYSVVPTSFYHHHHGPIEPLVKCKKEDGTFVADENASPAYYVSAVSTYRLNQDEGAVYPTYFYTSDGVPSGENDGTPVPYDVGSLQSSVNGIQIPLSYSAADAEDGRLKISDNSPYFPKYVGGDDFDLFTVQWVRRFEEETESLGPASAPVWDYEEFTSATSLEIRDSSPKTIDAFLLRSVPSARANDWENPAGWKAEFERLSTPTAVVNDDGSVIGWNEDSDPEEGQGGWVVLREDNGSSFDYYLGWFSSSSPNYPLGIFYQCDA